MAEAGSVEVSVVMPCLNEAETLDICIRKAQRALQKANITGEVIVADNGSTDGSAGIAEQLGARVVHVEAKGYGSALSGGIAAASGRYIIMGDADDSYDFGDIPRFVEQMRAGADLVMGNRFRGEIKPGAMPLLHKYLGNPVLSGMGRLFFKSSLGDFHCGLRGFSKDAYARMELQTTGMEFASEMVIKATLLKLAVAEVPISLSPDGRSRPPHLRTWRDGWRHLRFLLLYSPRWLFLYPGVLLMVAGAAGALWLIPGSRKVGAVTFDIHTLLYAIMAILVGFQAVAFAVFTKVFAITEGFLPEDPRLNKAFRTLKLETGLLLGAVLVLGGAVSAAYSIITWDRRGFGPLDPTRMVRVVAITIMLITLGVQMILASFFLSVLGLKRR